MRGDQGLPAPVGLSVRVYSTLLAAYPGRFRAEYGSHMLQVFRDVCRREYRESGLIGMTALWLRTTLDLVRTTVEEHVERGFEMDREKFVKWSGWALMAGAILFAAGLIIGNFDSNWNDPVGGVDAFYEISQIAGMGLGQIFFVIGLLGLRSGYAERSGRLGAFLLIAALVGGGISLGGMTIMSTSEARMDCVVRRVVNHDACADCFRPGYHAASGFLELELRPAPGGRVPAGALRGRICDRIERGLAG